MRDLDAIASALSDVAPIDWSEIDRTDDAPIAELQMLAVLFAAFRDVQHLTDDPSATGDAVAPASNRWGPLIVQQEIGRGASSVVFHAVDTRLGRDVALKVMTGLEALPTAVASMTSAAVVEEGRLLAKIRHPNVVTVFGADVFEGRVGIWMELLHGRTLEQLVQDQGQYSAAEAAAIGVEVCSALGAIHRAGLLHHDVKTQNVMRERGGRIVLMDLGASAEPVGDVASGGTSLAGTPLYMAPELFDGKPSNVRSEIYSFGVLLFRLVTGSFPVPARTLSEVKNAHRARTVRSLAEAAPDLPADFQELVDRALDPDPAQRFESAGAVHRALLAFLKGHQESTVQGKDIEPGAESRLARRASASFSWRLIALVLTAGLLLGTAVPWLLGQRINGGQAPSPATDPRLLKPGMSEQLDIAFAFEDLAGSVAAKGDWLQAAAHYEQARQVYLANVDDDAPVVALGHARKGWALFKGGKLDEARFNLELVDYLLKQELGVTHPYYAVTLMALGAVHQARGDHHLAASCVARALEHHQHFLSSLGISVAPATMPMDALVNASQSFSIAADTDGDWIPDMVEASAGLDPRRADRDRRSALLFGLSFDPTAVIVHAGAKDPQLVGFRQSRPFNGTPVGNLGWKVGVDIQGHYYLKLTETQKARAAQQGFRSTVMIAPLHGGGALSIDLGSRWKRWDIRTSGSTERGFEVVAVDSVVPDAGPSFPLTTSRSPFLQLIYDPARASARLLADGHETISNYRGHDQFLEGYGVMFGASNMAGVATRGEMDFFVAMLEIR